MDSFCGREMVNNTALAPHPTFTFFPGFSEVGGRAFSVAQRKELWGIRGNKNRAVMAS